MQKWEYLEIVFGTDKNGQQRLSYENGQRVCDWEHSPLKHEYVRQIAEQGWELAAVPDRGTWIFKRPKYGDPELLA